MVLFSESVGPRLSRNFDKLLHAEFGYDSLSNGKFLRKISKSTMSVLLQSILSSPAFFPSN